VTYVILQVLDDDNENNPLLVAPPSGTFRRTSRAGLPGGV
jgi:hypothetical protein